MISIKCVIEPAIYFDYIFLITLLIILFND